MMDDPESAGRLTLWGMDASLYTAKVLSYCFVNSVPFDLKSAQTQEFERRIVPQIGRWIIPVVEWPDGTICQDSSDILHWLDGSSEHPHPLLPPNAPELALSFALDLFASEGLLRPAMHYRWNFDDDNLHFIATDFAPRDEIGLVSQHAGSEERVLQMSRRMRKATTRFGVNEQTAAAVEQSYIDLLDVLEELFTNRPFILGCWPTLADYALMGPLYAHLGRDPHPSSILKSRAPRVWHWIERMLRPVSVKEVSEIASSKEDLIPLLGLVAQDFVPEIRAHVGFANDWLQKNASIEPGTNGLRHPGARVMGFTSFAWRGHQIITSVMMYRFYLLQKLQETYDGASVEDKEAIDHMFDRSGLSALLSERVSRRVVRNNHLEVWE